ncbi:heterokaryon incompatibility protein-domain-containing protein [Xylaria telfairii]|nr:heterokaryon incompatibility protein-domain-containing protein [Xylaria telfairii]
MMENLMERDENVAYIDERYRTLTRAEPLYQSKTFSFEDPHTCHHCQNVFITVVTEVPPTTCLNCLWKGVGAPATDGRHRLCGQCSKPYVDGEERVYSATLDYNLLEAIAASKEGCALYECVVDNVVLKILEQDDWRVSDVLYSVAYKFQLFGKTYASKSNLNARCVLRMTATSADTLAANITPKTLFLDDLQGWTTTADPAAKYISCRPYERDVKSTRSVKFARDCFQDCFKNHHRCSSFLTDKSDREARTPGLNNALATEIVDIAHVPSRLIYVGLEAGHVMLIEIKEAPDEIKVDVSRSGFAALSYCWGGDQPLSLTKGTHRDLKIGIHIPTLPQTLQDAVWVTRKMDVRYLWIDALCIFQDSDEDKTTELARMATYYSCAILTICAAAASRSTEGFLHARNLSPYGFGPVRLRLWDSSGEAGNVYVLKEVEPGPEPTVTRGWTLQESLLSRRILVFAQRQLYWCCVNSFAGCGGEFVGLVGRVAGNRATLVDDIHPMGSLLDLPTEKQWKMVVKQYTQRRLGFAADKLLAVSALAESLSRLCSERGQDAVYLAGLLVQASDLTSWLKQLLWYSARPRAGTRRAVPYRSPSWSWAAVDGPVQFASVDWDRTMSMATVADVSVDLVAPTVRFGSVRGGFIVLESMIRSLADCVRLPLGHRILDDWDDEKLPAGMAESIDFFPDIEEDGATIESIFTGIEPDRSLFLLHLGWAEWRVEDFSRTITRAVGLVVAHSDAIREAFTRVGVFRIIRDGCTTSLAGDVPPAVRFDLHTPFSSHDSRLIRIV